MANEIVKQSKPVDALKSVINAPSIQEQFKNALGNHKDAFVASLIDLFTGDTSIQKCDAKSLVVEALRAATLKLPLNKALGFAYIIVFNKSVRMPNGSYEKVPTPTFVPGYKGYIQLAMRTGQYRNINADFVYEGEMRKVDKLTGEISFDGERLSDKIVGYFCHFELLNGFSKTLYMSVEEMAKYALAYSPSFKGRNRPTVDVLISKAQSGFESNEVGWSGNFNDMALKTVVRRLLSKYGYLSVEMAESVSRENESDYANRNDVISEGANKKVITLDASNYEQVDTSTGEIHTEETSAEEVPEEEAPQY